LAESKRYRPYNFTAATDTDAITDIAVGFVPYPVRRLGRRMA